jgi:hypothetical protein
MSDTVFSRPAPRSYTQMRLVGAARNAPTPRPVLRIDAAGKALAARTIARIQPNDREQAFENESLVAHVCGSER